MRILLVEDEDFKRSAISSELAGLVGTALQIVECGSLRGGLKEMVSGVPFDLVLLDMSMPGFEIPGEAASLEEPESFAGKELLAQMTLREIIVPVVVITQYRAFAKGTIDLDDLTRQCASEFPLIFRRSIYYNTVVDSWKRDLFEVVQEIKNAGTNG